MGDDEYISEAEARSLLEEVHDRRLREAALIYACATGLVKKRRLYPLGDQHQEAFSLAGRYFYQLNPEWLREMEAFDRLYCTFHEEACAGRIPDSHLDFFASECYRVMGKFHLPNCDILLALYGQYRLQGADEKQERWTSIQPPVARELTIPCGKYTVTIRMDPTLGSRLKRFDLISVAATLFTYYLSRSGGGTLSYDQAINHFESLVCPDHFVGGSSEDFPYDLLTYHLDRDQFFRNLRRFSCLLTAPWWQLPPPQPQPAPDTTAPTLS